MADFQKEIGQDKEEVESLSELNKKSKYLLDELSELIDNSGGDYGLFLMEELQRRLEFVVQNFNEEVMALIKISFEKWKIKDSQIRDLIAGNRDNLQTPKNQPGKSQPEVSSKPNFIKDVEFGSRRRK